MKKVKSKKTIGLSLTALVLILGLTVGSAMAYFTTYATAESSIPLNLGATVTVPEEDTDAQPKEIIVYNTGDYDCYVRLKALVGSQYTVQYSEEVDEGKWTPGADGYYYYSDIVPAKTGNTSQINVRFDFPGGLELPDFNVIIIQESTPVLYNADGTPYADWDAKADVMNPVPAPQPQE